MSNPEPPAGDPSATPPPSPPSTDPNATVAIPAMPLPPPPPSDPVVGATPPPAPPASDPGAFGTPPPPPPPPPAGGGFAAPPPPGGFGAPPVGGGVAGATPYGAAPYGAYGAPAAAPKTGMALGALICGILGLLIAFIPLIGYGGSLLGLVAIVLGFLGVGAAKRQGGAGRGMAIGGIATGVLSIVISIAWTFLFVLAADDVNDDLDRINSDPSDGICNEERFIEDPDC